MYFLYSFVTLVALLALSPYFLYQALRHNKYVGSLGQRLGYLPVSFNLDGEESIWVHAVSVGEVLAARSLIADLRLRHPRRRRGGARAAGRRAWWSGGTGASVDRRGAEPR